ncbi:coagulation factor IX isoform X2 [Corythoichthys intestinalis]|uniref:coagulation factor IX isoform X2 n=1 Tax=Corythoichthys intestinalis TaxID=161448 RepID=UPI0025A5B04B|nr:coagulation factor IX isoform X2 [Corythoichthys intestinalis]
MLMALANTTVLLLFSAAAVESTVFLQRASAGQVLRSSAANRRRRANSNLLEEMFPGDLERECFEERCSQEEAAEIFQSQEKTLEFWFRYSNLNPCGSNPCLNGGKCMLGRGDFLCLCPPRYHGSTCHLELLSCNYKNGGCLQYCTNLPGSVGVQCGCAEGFQLDSDGQSCSKTVKFPCGLKQTVLLQRGRSLWSLSNEVNFTTEADIILDDGNFTMEADTLVDDTNITVEMNTILDNGFNWTHNASKPINPRIVGGDLERLGGSPWQVLIHRADGYGFCGGTLVSDRWVVSAAHCFQQTAHYVTIGDYDKRRHDPGEQKIAVKQVLLHPHFHEFTMDSDLALLYLDQPVVRGPTAVPACLPDAHLSRYLLKENNRGLVTGWGATQYLRRSSRFLRKVALPVVNHHACTQSTEQDTWTQAWMRAAGTAVVPSLSTTGGPGF